MKMPLYGIRREVFAAGDPPGANFSEVHSDTLPLARRLRGSISVTVVTACAVSLGAYGNSVRSLFN